MKLEWPLFFILVTLLAVNFWLSVTSTRLKFNHEYPFPAPGKSLLCKTRLGDGSIAYRVGYFGEESLFFMEDTDTVINVLEWSYLPELSNEKEER